MIGLRLGSALLTNMLRCAIEEKVIHVFLEYMAQFCSCSLENNVTPLL